MEEWHLLMPQLQCVEHLELSSKGICPDTNQVQPHLAYNIWQGHLRPRYRGHGQ